MIWIGDSQGSYGVTWFNTGPQAIIDGAASSSCSGIGVCCAGYTKIISVVLHIALRRSKIDAQDGVLDGVSGITVDKMVDVT